MDVITYACPNLSYGQWEGDCHFKDIIFKYRKQEHHSETLLTRVCDDQL